MSGNSWTLGERTLAHDPMSVFAGPDVAQLQTLLNDLGYRITDDGVFGPITAERVREFQGHRGLRVDGVFGPLTLRELSRVRELVAKPALPHYLQG